ncbi:uncharacterized protein [Nicotiana tomentosiformis]|uniref:uncharacterized protein n=1 Tax=Nicotiana tomentosiformis TaxID=4098 RepID=UPI00388C6751
MVSKDKIEGYRKFLGFKECISNANGKIWCFWKNLNQTTIIANEEQHISIKFEDDMDNPPVVITSVYAKCTSRERKNLWINLEDILAIYGPWCIGGDFNVILEPEEKLGGRPHRMHMSLDFQMCMDNYGVTDIGFSGPKYTWCNNWRPRIRIWKRLYRVFINDKWDQRFQTTTVKYLVRTGSDHRPLLINVFDTINNHIKYFKFLNFSTKHDGFSILLRKKVERLEELEISHNTEAERAETNKAHAEYIKWLSMQDSLITQKANINWFEEGDRNTNYFHSKLREKRRRLQLEIIKNHKGKWITGEDKIAKASIRYFNGLFNLPAANLDSSILQCITNKITDEENTSLIDTPIEEEIMHVVFNLCASSATGQDDYNGTFFQSCWDIIKEDIIVFVLDFFKAEVLSCSFNNLLLDGNFIPFSMPHNGPLINHLTYVDDIVIFTSGNDKSVSLFMKVFNNYEVSSGQLVNTDKSFFLTAPNSCAARINRIRNCIGFMDKDFPFTYLGCPIYIGRKKLVYFDNMVNKVVKNLSGWQGTFMSGGLLGVEARLLRELTTDVVFYYIS